MFQVGTVGILKPSGATSFLGNTNTQREINCCSARFFNLMLIRQKMFPHDGDPCFTALWKYSVIPTLKSVMYRLLCFSAEMNTQPKIIIFQMKHC